MEILRDQAAIDYLDRARSCLRPEVDNFGSIPLLAKLISLEKIFLTRLIAKGQTGFPLSIGDYGLPELAAWRIDIIKTFEEVDVVRANRARALDPLLQELANASATGLDKKFGGLQNTLEADQSLIEALAEFSQDEVDFLTQRWDSSLSFPFYTEKYAPGLLLSRSDKTPFSERRGKRKRFNGLAFRPGFKYIDTDPESSRDPFFLMVAFSSERQALGCRLITQKTALLSRSRLVNTEEHHPTNQTSGYNIETTIEYFDLALQKRSAVDVETAKLERGLQKLRPAIFRALYQTDYTDKRSSLDAYFKALLEVNTLVNEAAQFSEEILELKPISSNESTDIKNRFAFKLSEIYNAVGDDDLRRVLQIAMASEMSQIRRQTEAAKIRPINQTGLLGRLKIFKRDDQERTVN